MESSTPAAERVPMGRLLAATAAAAAVCTPPKSREPKSHESGSHEPKPGDQGTTCTRVPSGAKSQRV